MGERLQTLQHRGKQILLIDGSHASSAEMISLLADVQDRITQQCEKCVLALSDFTGCTIDRDVATRIKEVLVFDRPYIKRAAWVGVESIPHVVYENFKTFSQRELPAFKTRAEAMDWLVEDATPLKTENISKAG